MEGRNKAPDLTGMKYNRLLAVERLGMSKNGKRLYKFLCDCGTEKIIQGSYVKRGDPKSCGCLVIETIKKMATQHGHSRIGARSSEYSIWAGIIQRCENKNSPSYKNYGGRGIKICQRWRHDFSAFFSDMGQRPQGMTIERINNDKDYSPENCRWATRADQARNNSRNVYITHNGETKTRKDWADYYGIDDETFRHRLSVKKMSFEDAINKPIKSKKGNK